MIVGRQLSLPKLLLPKMSTRCICNMSPVAWRILLEGFLSILRPSTYGLSSQLRSITVNWVHYIWGPQCTTFLLNIYTINILRLKKKLHDNSLNFPMDQGFCRIFSRFIAAAHNILLTPSSNLLPAIKLDTISAVISIVSSGFH